uniref:Centromere protein Cenp-F N-terminal domain-containing protein n=1 Tax=Pygocentrus nattereri TaxID=42514 RepID=A0AAR2LED1_PYGNA
MSWATEDWTTGLSGRVLQKVQELQAHNEKLNRERQQRQLQLDNSEAALHKQKQKVAINVHLTYCLTYIRNKPLSVQFPKNVQGFCLSFHCKETSQCYRS